MVMYKKDILTMNKIIKLIFVLCCFCGIAQAQPQRPKLVVGIVIDHLLAAGYMVRVQNAEHLLRLTQLLITLKTSTKVMYRARLLETYRINGMD